MYTFVVFFYLSCENMFERENHKQHNLLPGFCSIVLNLFHQFTSSFKKKRQSKKKIYLSNQEKL